MTQYFCYLAIYTLVESIIEWVIAVMAILIFARSVLQYRVVREICHSKHVHIIYYLLFAWNIVYFGRVLYAEIIYLVTKDNNTSQQLSILSKSYFVCDMTSVFLLQWILIFIPYNWVRNVISIFNQLANMESAEEQTNDQSTLLFEIFIQKVLKVYLIGRFVVYGVIIAFCKVDDPQTEQIFVEILSSLLFFQAICVTIILGLGIHAIKNNKKLNSLIEENEIQLMVNQYSILIACTILRLLADAYYLYQKFGIKKTECSYKQQHNYVDFIMLIVEAMLTHFLPIIIVQRIYKIDKKDYDLTKSLLAADPYRSEDFQSSEDQASPKRKQKSQN